MKTKGLVLIVSVLMVLNLVIGGRLYSKTDKDDYKNMELFQTVIQMVKKFYVDEDKVETEDLVY